MKTGIRVAVLGAGLGSRMQGLAKAKPLARIAGKTLVDRLQNQFLALGAGEILFALREELLGPADKQTLPPQSQYLFVNTESSLHTLADLVAALGASRGPVLFSMVDTILRDSDLAGFWKFCAHLPAGESALLVTPFVEDEKPLWVQVDDEGYVKKFGAEGAHLVTSGMYFLSPAAMALAPQCTGQGMQKMRNFLAALVEQRLPIKTFVVEKTIDVDHPSDLESAEHFLRGSKGSSP